MIGRRLFLALVGGATAGCAFEPLYGPGGGGEALRGAVALDTVDGREGFAFTRRLRQRIGDAEPGARWLLDVALRLRASGLAIDEESQITRYDVIGSARYALRDREGGEPVASGTVESRSAYSTLAAPYATLQAQRDAERRVAEDLADRVFGRLAAAAARGALTA